ncbi:MAG: imidazoleglycerol-phosphate dehydratase HisB [Planctomycetota bacterium]|nr:imidazoleglycerol-phosphate dehydratase HisB [Planctomycetota bacterium]
MEHSLEHSGNRRVAQISRVTRETTISLALDLDGGGRAIRVKTGIGFLDHMLSSLALHSGFDLDLACEGDLHVDDHHTAEDCAIALGQALDRALGTREGIVRFGSCYAPLDEALARSVVDLVTRPHCSVDLGLRRESLGGLSCENVPHVFVSLAMNARLTLHVDVLKGENDHHRAEAAFKSLALALRQAVSPRAGGVLASTKGVI